MKNLLYTIAVILVVMWVIGFVGFNAGGTIHFLLLVAVITVIIRIIQSKNNL